MKFLFIVQGEGRGHLTQAMTLEKMLMAGGHEVVGMLVGKSPQRKLPEFFRHGVQAPIHQFQSVNFQPSAENRTANLLKSVAYNVVTFPQYFKSVNFIKDAINSSGADVVVNFYELLTGVAYLNFRIDVPNVSIGHQYLFLHEDFRLSSSGILGTDGLVLYTKLTAIGARKRLALSFRKMSDDGKHKIRVVPPLLRKEVLDLKPTGGDYIHGYMLNSGFADDVLNWHREHPEVKLRFFWDNWSEGPVKKIDDTLSFYLLDDKEFLRQMAGCMAYASTAGFESVCEAAYLGKPVLMVPSHVEQKCNAFDASQCGIGVEADSFDLSVLMKFAADYSPLTEFPEWARSALSVIYNELTDL